MTRCPDCDCEIPFGGVRWREHWMLERILEWVDDRPRARARVVRKA